MDLAGKYRASLTLVHVCEIPAYGYSGMQLGGTDFFTPLREAARRHLDDEMRELRKTVPEATGILRIGIPAQEILQTMNETHADLVVMGTHGRRGLEHLLLGSVAEKVVRMSPVPVLTVRDSGTSPAQGE